MKKFILIILLIISYNADATTYFISTSGSDSSTGTGVGQAWATLNKVQAEAEKKNIKAGDSILFKRGDIFTGILKWSAIAPKTCASGTASQPITFSAYGTGNNPVFLYPPGGSTAEEDRILMLFTGVNYIVVDGLDFTDSDATNDKISGTNCGVPIYLGTIGEATTNYCTIKNVNISLCGMGIVIVGDFNKVTASRLTNFKNLKSTPDTGGSSAYDDYGANAITITGNDNEISHCYISGAWAESLDFGWNGGACEMYNNCSRNKMIYNSIYDCGGVAEFGAQQANAVSADNLFAFNTIINCGTLTYCNTNGEFAVQVSNVQYFNNTIIEDSSSRFSGPNTGRGIETAGPKALIQADAILFAFNGKPTAPIVFNLRNNIFQLSNGMLLATKSNHEKYSHEDNLYIMLSGSAVNFDLNKSESIKGKPAFRQVATSSQMLWQYELLPSKKDEPRNEPADKPAGAKIKSDIEIQRRINKSQLITAGFYFEGKKSCKANRWS